MTLYFLSDSTGNIYGSYRGDIPSSQGAYGYISVADGTDPTIYWNNGGTLTAKIAQSLTVTSTSITANGSSSCTISGIASGSIVSFITPLTAEIISDITITDGTIVFTATHSGIYIINIDLFPYQTFTVTITAT